MLAASASCRVKAHTRTVVTSVARTRHEIAFAIDRVLVS